MKRITIIVVGVVLFGVVASAQEQQPFIFTAYGGLFFPSYKQFPALYQSNSDLIWGVGVCWPIQSSLLLTADIGTFNSDGLPNSINDSTAKLEERFIHLGLLNKQPILPNFFIRLQGGLSYATIKQTTSSAQSVEQSVEADKKLGWYGGIGIEEYVTGTHVSLFGDVLYDYRRSHRQELSGDFGGVRAVMGVSVVLF